MAESLITDQKRIDLHSNFTLIGKPVDLTELSINEITLLQAIKEGSMPKNFILQRLKQEGYTNTKGTILALYSLIKKGYIKIENDTNKKPK